MVDKTNTGVYVHNNLFTSMEEMINSFFVKPVQTIQGKQHETVQWKLFINPGFCSHCSGETKPQIKMV